MKFREPNVDIELRVIDARTPWRRVRVAHRACRDCACRNRGRGTVNDRRDSAEDAAGQTQLAELLDILSCSSGSTRYGTVCKVPRPLSRHRLAQRDLFAHVCEALGTGRLFSSISTYEVDMPMAPQTSRLRADRTSARFGIGRDAVLTLRAHHVVAQRRMPTSAPTLIPRPGLMKSRYWPKLSHLNARPRRKSLLDVSILPNILTSFPLAPLMHRRKAQRAIADPRPCHAMLEARRCEAIPA